MITIANEKLLKEFPAKKKLCKLYIQLKIVRITKWQYILAILKAILGWLEYLLDFFEFFSISLWIFLHILVILKESYSILKEIAKYHFEMLVFHYWMKQFVSVFALDVQKDLNFIAELKVSLEEKYLSSEHKSTEDLRYFNNILFHREQEFWKTGQHIQ